MTRADIIARITDYLAGGGLFNPEMANHEAVRDLLIDCRAALAQPATGGDEYRRGVEDAARVLDGTARDAARAPIREHAAKAAAAIRALLPPPPAPTPDAGKEGP